MIGVLPPTVPRRSFRCGSVPAVSPPPLHFSVRRTVGRNLQGIKSATEISPLLKRNDYAGNKLFSIYSPKKEMAGARSFLTVELVQTRSHSKCFGVCCAKKSFQYGREVL